MNTWNDEAFEKFCKQADFDMNYPEVKEIGSRIWTFIHELARFIGREDCLFKNFVIPSGSFYEDLKSESPDEFDFMICLEDLSQPGVCTKTEIPLRPVRDPGYLHVQVTSKAHQRRWRHYISRQGNLKPDSLLKEFQRLIKEALRKMKPAEGDKLKWNTADGIDVQLRKIPVTMNLTWNGKKYRNFEINIDLTLCIEMPGWPDASDIEKRVKRDDPSYEVIRKAMSAGHHLVASTIGESGKKRPCWRLSFSAAEGILLKEICKDPRLIHKKTLKVLKVLRKRNEDDLCLLERSDGEEYSPFHQSYIMITWALSSYVLKTMFLQEWLENPQDSKWREDQIRKRAEGILQRVEDSVSGKDIRSFWVPDYKLFNFRARKATQIGRACSKLSSIRQRLVEPKKQTSEDECPELCISRLLDRVKLDKI